MLFRMDNLVVCWTAPTASGEASMGYLTAQSIERNTRGGMLMSRYQANQSGGQSAGDEAGAMVKDASRSVLAPVCCVLGWLSKLGCVAKKKDAAKPR